MELSLFALVGAFVYAFAGQYSEAPAVIVLRPLYKKIAFAFVLPPTIIIGVIVSRLVTGVSREFLASVRDAIKLDG